MVTENSVAFVDAILLVLEEHRRHSVLAPSIIGCAAQLSRECCKIGREDRIVAMLFPLCRPVLKAGQSRISGSSIAANDRARGSKSGEAHERNGKSADPFSEHEADLPNS